MPDEKIWEGRPRPKNPGIPVVRETSYEKRQRYRRWIFQIIFVVNFIALAFALWERKLVLISKEHTSAKPVDTLTELAQISESLKRLGRYVENQQTTVRETEAAISRLKNEKDRLESVVSIDRNHLDAYLAAVKAGSVYDLWLERGIGFLSGTLASLLAGVIYERYLRKQNDE